MKDFKNMTVGEIVADNFKYATIFNQYNIDFCCNGMIPLPEACVKADVDINKLTEKLENTISVVSPMIDFNNWQTNLLVDYILKFHHHNIRANGPRIATLLDKVCRSHASSHPELLEVQKLFAESLTDLYNHLQKEEMVLFPYIYELCETEVNHTTLPNFHCGSIENPIFVMMAEHDAESERYRQIAKLTNDYTAPVDACNSYRLVLDEIKMFEEALHHHIHLENNIIFPRAIKIEHNLRG